MDELISKIRRYCADHGTDEFTKASVETEISRLQTDQVTIDVFKIDMSILLQIDVNNL